MNAIASALLRTEPANAIELQRVLQAIDAQAAEREAVFAARWGKATAAGDHSVPAMAELPDAPESRLEGHHEATHEGANEAATAALPCESVTNGVDASFGERLRAQRARFQPALSAAPVNCRIAEGVPEAPSGSQNGPTGERGDAEETAEGGAGEGQRPEDGAGLSNLGRAALDYAKRGMHVFPLWPGRKQPIPKKGCSAATRDAALIERWWSRFPDAGIAVNCGKSGLIVIDVDPRNGGAESWAAFVENNAIIGDVASNVVSRTGGGGEHHLFRIPASCPPLVSKFEQAGLGAGIDVKTGNSYIVLAPSVHPDGPRYKWLKGGDETPRELPDWIVDLLKRPELSVSREQLGEPIDDSTWASLRDALPFVSPKNSYEAWRDLGFQLHSTGRDEALELFHEMCEGWGFTSEEEAAERERLWANADSRASRSDIGRLTTFASLFREARVNGWTGAPGRDSDPENVFEPIHGATGSDEPDEAAAQKARRLTLEQGQIAYFDGEPPRRDYLFDGVPLVAGTATFLYGLGGFSKTQLVIQMAEAVACGDGLVTVPKPGGALLFLGEEDEEERNRRFTASLRAAEVSMDIKPNALAERQRLISRRVRAFGMAGQSLALTRTQITGGRATQTELVEQIIRLAAEHEIACGMPVRLIAIDHARLAIGGNGNASEDVTVATQACSKIARASGALVLIVGHANKAGVGKAANKIGLGAADLSGSQALIDNTRGALVLEAASSDETKGFAARGGGDFMKLSAAKANYGPCGVIAFFERIPEPSCGVAVLHPATKAKWPPFDTEASSADRADDRVVEQIFAVVEKQTGRLTMRKLRDYAGVKDEHSHIKASAGVAERVAQEMIAAGQLKLVEPDEPTKRERHLRKGDLVLICGAAPSLFDRYEGQT
jgi:hypothetical protein